MADAIAESPPPPRPAGELTVQAQDPARPAAAPERPVRAQGPIRVAVRAFRRHRLGVTGLAVLALLYAVAIFADFVAPYRFDDETRDLLWAPPTPIRFRDASGFSWRPFIHPFRMTIDENLNLVPEPDRSQRCYIRFFAPSRPDKLLGLVPISRRLLGVDPPVQAASPQPLYSRLYLMGADSTGRDVFSRICYGSRISMTIGLCGAGIVLMIGLTVGGVSGYVGGRVDDLLQRLCEMVMLLPGFYLLLMLRFMFPANMSSVKVYFAVILILSLVGWAGLARVIRGMVLSIRTLDFIQAARALGLTHWRIIRRHVLPNTMGYTIVSLTLSIPGYILGESALSILGLGIMEPIPSWGNMLSQAMDINQLEHHPWVLWPGAFIFLAVMAFNLVGDGLRDSVDPHAARR
jgi:peptide/nickel transport system permease protein